MAQLKLTAGMDARNQVLCSTDTELRGIFLEGFALLDFDTDICKRIEADIDRAAKEQKKRRILDRQWQVEQTLPLFEDGVSTLDQLRSLNAAELVLGVGRLRRLDGEAVFLFGLCRGLLGSITDQAAVDRLRDSTMVHDYLAARGLRLPSPNCIWAYLNAVSPATHDYLDAAMIRSVAGQKLDDMSQVTIDSFAVSANTAWPTDSSLLLKLLCRAFTVGSRMQEQYGVPGFSAAYVPDWLAEMKSLDFRISCTCGKPNAKPTVEALYRELLQKAVKIIERLGRQVQALEPVWQGRLYKPSVQRRYEEAIGTIFDCLGQAICICEYAEKRISEGDSRPAAEKILSISDRMAAYIKKGGREAIIGYKPQILRTGNGFITVAELRVGNPNDASRFLPVVEEHIAKTRVVPGTAGSDDGYTGARVRADLQGLGIAVVSMNGSKGKKLIPELEWESAEYVAARNARSAVESAIWVLRCKFSLYRFTRRGLEAVRAELQEKVLVYNLWRCALLRRRQAEGQAARAGA